MTEVHKKYRLTSTEEPTDEMLQALMEDVAAAARESSARAEEMKHKLLRYTAHLIAVSRSQPDEYVDDLPEWEKKRFFGIE